MEHDTIAFNHSCKGFFPAFCHGLIWWARQLSHPINLWLAPYQSHILQWGRKRIGEKVCPYSLEAGISVVFGTAPNSQSNWILFSMKTALLVHEHKHNLNMPTGFIPKQPNVYVIGCTWQIAVDEIPFKNKWPTFDPPKTVAPVSPFPLFHSASPTGLYRMARTVAPFSSHDFFFLKKKQNAIGLLS